MARPRKDQTEPSATERIKAAFWELLEEHDIKHLTVNLITEKAGCNRGTFYYHFDSMDELLYCIIEEELSSADGLPRDLLALLSNKEGAAERIPERVQRFGLMMKQAGQTQVASKVKRVVLKMWSVILCPNEGEELTEASRVMVEYSIGGLISVIEYLYEEEKLNEMSFPADASFMITENARFMFTRISTAQGISLPELEQRFSLFLKAQQ